MKLQINVEKTDAKTLSAIVWRVEPNPPYEPVKRIQAIISGNVLLEVVSALLKCYKQNYVGLATPYIEVEVSNDVGKLLRQLSYISEQPTKEEVQEILSDPKPEKIQAFLTIWCLLHAPKPRTSE